MSVVSALIMGKKQWSMQQTSTNNPTITWSANKNLVVVARLASFHPKVLK
jgi:hypothetical protein